MPIRVQRKRTRGWKMPPNTVSVTRPGFWGNPFRVDAKCTSADAVAAYRLLITRGALRRQRLGELRGKNLACYCPLDQPCHADVLLELANGVQK